MQPAYRCRHCCHSASGNQRRQVIDWRPPMEGNNGIGDICCFPFPYKAQRVYLCGCCEWLRQIDDQGKEDPFNHCACGCWWWSWIACGAGTDVTTDTADHNMLYVSDPDTMVDMEATGHLAPVAKKFGWQLPAFGSEVG